VRLQSVFLDHCQSVFKVKFDDGRFTVLFGKNNAGKSNILEALYGLFAFEDTRVIRSRVEIAGLG
jgi:AAA15 family ATPase/GTPase